MKKKLIAASAFVFGLPLAQLCPAMAADASATAQADIKSGAVVISSDGHNIGAVDRVILDAARKAVAVSVIFDTRFVRIPVSTLSHKGEKLVTSLTYRQVEAVP